MKIPFRPALALAVACFCASPMASAQTTARQEHGALRETISRFLQTQAGGMPGQIRVEVGAIDPRLNLAACPNPEAYLPPGGKAWGKTSVGVRCLAPAWNIYVSANVHIEDDYLAAAVPLAPGQTVGPQDVARVRGDLTLLPPGILTDPAQAVGQTVTRSLPAGAALRADGLRAKGVVTQGQMVRVVAGGNGFQVTGEGRALANAVDGQTIQVRTAGGTVVSGVARAGGSVEVAF
ncbi:flagellar basal body P-ring formation protein FlgA [Noviherbaspirillum sp. DKR-6]|uniref:Flagella basal body P-ring formation protein FlgA n=2 Tax=Noviherbaspirillum pedocola TaxID=2801341 RepID=A0A934W811_9BURK|nr:flagellar basal body P-ring formation protein FlgA [Noviherbaspirillum pedocola]